MHQVNIYHRHFVNDDGICFQRIFFISLKMHAGGIFIVRRNPGQLQKAVDSPRLITSCLGHALGCAAGRRRQQDFHLFLFEVTDDSIDRGRFTGTRTAGDDQKAAVDRLDHCSDLQLIGLDFLLRTDHFQFFTNLCFRLGTAQV